MGDGTRPPSGVWRQQRLGKSGCQIDAVASAQGLEVLRHPAHRCLATEPVQCLEELGVDGESRFAVQVFKLLDWAPARLTGLAFAVVGDFEDAAYCWRTQAAKWPDPSLGVVLASGAGAMGVRLGMPFLSEMSPVDRPELGLGDQADVGFLDSTIGLVWRALVVILFILLLLAIARALS